MSINRPELIDIIAKKGNISKVEAKKALELTIEAISEALAKGEDVTLIGFGTFKVTELAERTGYTKTDNRYYWAEAGVFLSVDPLCDERPWITPFNYAQNNPVGRKDPTGMLDDKYFDEKGNYLGDDGKGNNIRIITKNQFAMFTDNGNVSPVEIESELKMIGVLFSDYVQKTEMSSENQLKVYDYFNPTDLSIENSTKNFNMAFTNGTSGKDNKILINLQKNLNHVDNFYNVTNMFEHENKHYIDYKKLGHNAYISTPKSIREQNAINYQMNHSSWVKTSDIFKKGVIKYGKHFNLLSKIERIIVLFTLLFLLLINYTYSQIEFKVNEITVSHIVETIKYGHIIEGAFGNGPLITVSCEINNKTNDTIALDLENYKILIFFNYYEKKYEKELGSIVDEISLEFNKYFEKNKTNTILPNTKFLFSFMTPYLLGTELLKDTYPIVDCTTEVIETLPTLRVRYMDSNIDIITNEILKVTVANFIYNYD